MKKDEQQVDVPQVDMDKESENQRHCFFSYILGAKLVGHILHLQEDSFAGHIALDEFYKSMQKIADSIIEAFQGAFKHVLHYDKDCLVFGMDLKPLVYLGRLRDLIQSMRYEVIDKEVTNIHNEIDNFITQIDSTTYKLTYLK